MAHNTSSRTAITEKTQSEKQTKKYHHQTVYIKDDNFHCICIDIYMCRYGISESEISLHRLAGNINTQCITMSCCHEKHQAESRGSTQFVLGRERNIHWFWYTRLDYTERHRSFDNKFPSPDINNRKKKCGTDSASQQVREVVHTSSGLVPLLESKHSVQNSLTQSHGRLGEKRGGGMTRTLRFCYELFPFLFGFKVNLFGRNGFKKWLNGGTG